MALHWRPVGPEPAQTYWWRRTTLAIGVFFVLYVLARLLSGGDEPERLSAQDEATPAPSISASADPSGAEVDPSAAASPGAPPQACLPAALKLTVKADKTDYPVGGRPVLELAVAHDGPAPCAVDLGQASVELLIMSGSDRIWSSDDCSSGQAAKVVTLEPGKPDVTRLTWAGRRSLPGCEGAKAQAQPGTYRVSGRVGELRAQGDSFRLVE